MVGFLFIIGGNLIYNRLIFKKYFKADTDLDDGEYDSSDRLISGKPYNLFRGYQD